MRAPLIPGLALAMMISACGGEPPADDGDAARAEREARQAHEREIRDWRAARQERLLRPDGWLSLVGLHWINPGTTFIGSARENGTRLSLGPDQVGMLTLGKDGSARLRIAEGAEVLVDGEPAEGEVVLVPDSQGKPTVVAFNRGDASFILIERSGRHALRVRNAMARTRTSFPGIDYFEINPDFRFQARFEPHPPGKTMEIVNMLGMIEPMPNPGRVLFDKDGVTYSLEALDEGDGQLFFVFADRTSGHETYAASRMLYAAPAGPDGLTVLDFNRAYNPPCAFTPYSTCPMPPPENRLDLRVEAGEKKPLPFPE
ncbi:DUF1684 domain-containing protein [Arenimonas caeni]|jgi:uncharacterized protein (DUF1684 family)|uniref:DUF1684 domain-containing protein n=1 Tax=Arenimonas caeni TaxID=2058085 RepID=UPI002A35F4C5|nr:DUF1684 domain-containing protein [Arenimonas caeni]MDY0021933.1 DUF1684 domain-containing protein [Arenimonas caeni]